MPSLLGVVGQWQHYANFVCYCSKAEIGGQGHAQHLHSDFFFFFNLCMGIGSLMLWGIKPHSSGSGQGEGRSCDGMLSCRVLLSGGRIGPYDPSTAGMCQCLPSIPQGRLHFTRLIQGDAYHPLPQPGPIQPSGPTWFLLQGGECHGNASARMLTRRHAHAFAHTRLQPSASSAPLHALSVGSSTVFPRQR